MNKLAKSAETVVAVVKEKIPFLGDNDTPETDEESVQADRYIWSEKAKRFRDIENGRFVSREVALGKTAVAQVVAPPSKPRSKKASRSKSTAGTASTPNRKKNPSFGPRVDELDLEALWNGAGDREEVAEKLIAADPILYLRYVSARDKFIISEANARGAGIEDPEQKTSALGWIKNKLPSRSPKNRSKPEDFSTVYGEALTAALASYGTLTPEEQYERKRELEANAGYALEFDVAKKKLEASSKKRFSLTRRAALTGGFLVAGGLGAITGAWERMHKGEHDPRYLGFAAILGAVTGFGAAKAYRPVENDSTVLSQAEAARQAVESVYENSSPDSMTQKVIGIESVKDTTKRDRRRALGRTALGIGGGAVVGAGGHLLMDVVWPMVAGYTGDTSHTTSGTPTPPDSPVDPAVGVDSTNEAFNPLDTNHDHQVTSTDMPDRNSDGVIDHQDQAETYNSLDTNHDGQVDDADMPDTNSDGVIDRQDQAETYDPLDTNHDGVIDERDVPDANTDGSIDVDDLPQETEQETPPAEPVSEETPAQAIYVEPGSSITNEWHQYVYDTYGVNLTDAQLEAMYGDVIESGSYAPEQLFGEVDFYTMQDGRWGMQDIGSAQLTGTGQDVIYEWLHENHLMAAPAAA